MSPSQASVAIVFMTHFINDTICNEYRRLRHEAPADHDVILLYNTTERLPGEIPADIQAFRFNEEDLRRLRYPRKNTSVSSFNIDLFVINFWLNRTDYKFYWVIENDVRFSGDWGMIFRAFADDPADLLSTTMFRQPHNPDWANWSSLAPPPGVVLSADEKISSFLPFYRISQRGLAALHAGYQTGWAGHCECTVPSILARAGCSLEDIGGDGEFVRPENINRFYRNTPKARTHGPGTLVFRPIRTAAGEEANLLWHPVKCAQGMSTSRRQRALRRALILLRSGLNAVGI